MIAKIKLRNFKAFEDEELDIRPLTLIAGVNGMGKSSIIQSLLLLRQSYELESLQKREKKVRLRSDYVNLESVADLCYAWAKERTVGITLVDDLAQKYKWSINSTNADEDSPECIYEGSDMDGLSLFRDNFVFLSAERIGPREVYARSSVSMNQTRFGVHGEMTPSYLYKALITNENIAIKDMCKMEGQLQLIENLNAWMTDIMGIGMKVFPQEVDSKQVKVQYGYSNSIERYSALQVGFGFSYSIPVITALLCAHRGDLLIFENPEAHLHPLAQVNIGVMIAKAVSCGVQVILETHSDHIMNGIRLARKRGMLSKEQVMMFFVQRETEDGIDVTFTEKIEINDNGKLTARPPLFFDTWQDSLAQLI